MNTNHHGYKDYSAKWYKNRARRNQALSAKQLLPFIDKYIRPKSIVDIGCGVGEFLHAYQSAGVETVLGVDGAWVDKSLLLINRSDFMEADLELPLDLDRRFDLVISTEVAEHIPEPSVDVFIDTLISLGDIILFSAAIPLQGGSHHVNEQWPQYWADKFKARGFRVIDCIRPQIWNHPDIKYWHKQNLLFFCRHDVLKEYSEFEKYIEAEDAVLPLVHPFLYEYYARNFRRLSTRIPRFIKSLLKIYFK